MKTILVPTDFSAPAVNAASYAMHVAIRTGANIKICHAITESAKTAGASDGHTSPKSGSEKMLSLVDKLTKDAGDEIDLTEPDANIPAIDFVNETGSVTAITRKQVAEHHANLVVMGMSGNGTLAKLILGSNSQDMIDEANFPLLLIPSKATFKGIKKIGFATDLRKSDVEVINKLSYLARAFGAEILISHITEDKFEDHQERIDAFLNDVTCKINYSKIFYRHVKSRDTDHGLEWVAEHALVDILAMVHHPHNLLASIFEGSHTKKIAKKIEIPLLVFPIECNTPAF